MDLPVDAALIAAKSSGSVLGLSLTLLGGFEASVARSPVLTKASRKSRALLAYLALAGRRACPRDTLAALLWGEVPEDQSRQSLRKALFELRSTLADVKCLPLSTDGEKVSLIADEVDVLTFETLVRDGRPDALRQAMALCQGDLLEGLRVDEPAFEDWLTRERERLRRLAVEALERLLAFEIAEDRVEAAVGVALRLLLLDTTHEGAHRSLI